MGYRYVKPAIGKYAGQEARQMARKPETRAAKKPARRAGQKPTASAALHTCAARDASSGISDKDALKLQAEFYKLVTIMEDALDLLQVVADRFKETFPDDDELDMCKSLSDPVYDLAGKLAGLKYAAPVGRQVGKEAMRFMRYS